MPSCAFLATWILRLCFAKPVDGHSNKGAQKTAGLHWDQGSSGSQPEDQTNEHAGEAEPGRKTDSGRFALLGFRRGVRPGVTSALMWMTV